MDTMKELPKLIKRSIIVKTKVFCIESIQLLFANGARADYERLIGSNPGAVLIIPMLDAETVLLVREYVAGQEREVRPRRKRRPGKALRRSRESPQDRGQPDLPHPDDIRRELDQERLLRLVDPAGKRAVGAKVSSASS